MFFFRMMYRAFHRQVGRRLMIAITVFLGAALTTSMLAVMLDIGDKVKAELGSYGANIEVLPRSTSAISDLYETDADLSAHGALAESELPNLKTIFWAYNIEDFAPYLGVSGDVAGEQVPVIGTWYSKQLALPTGEETRTGMSGLRSWWEIDGEWLPDSADDQAMVGKRLAEQQGWARGDTVEIDTPNGAAELTIAAVFDSGSDEDRQLFTTLATAQRLADRPGEVDRVEVRAITTPENELAQRAARDPNSLSIEDWETWYCTAYVSSISYQIEEVMTDAAANPVRQIADTEGQILEKTQLIMVMVAVMAMVGSSLGIANLVTASVMERSKEIGLMKAIGARGGAITAQIVTETLVVGLVGGALGFLAGFGLAQIVGHLVFGASITMRPIVLPLMALIILATVLGGCIPSIRALLRLRPTQVLHGK